MYKVLVMFVDGENGRQFPPDDGGNAYAAGEEYPKNGFIPTESPLAYLLGDKNGFGKPVIEQTEKKDPAPRARRTRAE